MALELTVDALKKLYSDACVFMVGDDVLETVRWLAEDGIDILVLTRSGAVHCLDQSAEALDARVVPVGMAIGLRGILAGAKTEEAARSWVAFAERQKMHASVPVAVLSGFAGKKRLDASRFVLSQLHNQATDLQDQMERKEAGLAFMRRKNEQLLLNYEKARRMIRGTGYGLQQIAMELPVGDETAGPGGTIETSLLQQVLPGDSAGLWGVSLYFQEKPEAPLIVDGHVEVKVFRASDGKCLARDQRGYQHLREWCTFDMKEACGAIFGDAVLRVSWHGDLENAPLLALSSVEADRFGDGHGRTAALRVLKGLAEIPEDVEHGAAVKPVERKCVADSEVIFRHAWAFGDAIPNELDGSPLIEVNDEEGWIQTHAQAGNPSGFVLRNVLEVGALDASISVCTSHEAAPLCVYSLIAVEHRAAEGFEARRTKVLDYLGAGRGSANLSEGMHAVHQIVAPMLNSKLFLHFEEPLESAADLFMVVQSVKKTAAYAWCRWHDLRLGKIFDSQVTKLSAPKIADGSMGLRVRSFHFPDLAGRIEFVSGKTQLDELSKSLGFSPMLISEETGSLQTHPLKDQMSAAVLEAGVPSGTLRIASEVETTHDAAPAFMYMMAVVSPEVKERERVVRNVFSRLDPQNQKTWQGINGRKTIQWAAKSLFARRSDRIEIELALPLDEPADIVFAVKPVGESVAYGWCQWYSLNITTAPVIRQQGGQVGDHGDDD
ncbi:MAG: hypothetical protein HWE39_03200 [Oceanospirillaceae bacterium]|nr:hypothetical protein [Oceanospirillaceae bacterium]